MLSIVVNFYNNRREALNTLFSLTRAYQRDAAAIDFEVIALDHGSTLPLSEAEVRYLVENEWAQAADDVLWRRSKIGMLASSEQVAALERLVTSMKSNSRQ